MGDNKTKASVRLVLQKDSSKDWAYLCWETQSLCKEKKYMAKLKHFISLHILYNRFRKGIKDKLVF